MRTIDADALKDEIRQDLMKYACMIPPVAAIRAVDCVIDKQPTIEPRTKAKWIKPTGMMPPEHCGHYECSNCGFWAMRDWLRPRVVLTDFCPGCGADTREDNNG